jgi:hypothetical protein
VRVPEWSYAPKFVDVLAEFLNKGALYGTLLALRGRGCRAEPGAKGLELLLFVAELRKRMVVLEAE